MMGRRAPEGDRGVSSFLPQYLLLPNMLKEQEKNVFLEKRSYPGSTLSDQYPWMKGDFARLGKRGPPRLGLPSHWRRGAANDGAFRKRGPGLAGLRASIYEGFRYHPGSQWP